MPAIEGTSRLRSCWLPLKMTPPAARNSSGSTKLKKAALGLRQNMRRSRRYWRQPRTSCSGIGGELQVDLLERRPRDRDVLQARAACERLAGDLVQQRSRVVAHALHQLAAGLAVGDPVMRAAHPQF